jgi:lipopolysaccharide export system protein LptA
MENSFYGMIFASPRLLSCGTLGVHGVFFALRQNLILFFFALLSLAVVLSAQGLDWTAREAPDQKEDADFFQGRDESYFKEVTTHFINLAGPRLFLKADELTVYQQRSEVTFIKPRGVAYTEEQEPVHYTGLRGRYLMDDELLELFEQVEINKKRDWLKAQAVTYDRLKDFVDAREEVQSYLYFAAERDQIFINSDHAFGTPGSGEFEYVGNVDGRIVRQRAYEPPIYFKSRRLLLNLPIARAQLFDDVFLKKQDLTATSYTGELFLDNYNKKLKYFVLNDDVKIVEKVKLGADSFERRAFAEQLEGITSENKLILTGFPRVFQHQDVIKGNRITLRENSEVIEVEDSHTNFIIGR